MLTGKENVEVGNIDPGKGKMLILALDRSGSMSGQPFNALKEAAKIVGKAIQKINKIN